MSCRKVQCPANTEGNPTTDRQRRMCKFAARLRELHNQLVTNDKYKLEGRNVSDNVEKQRQQLWQNITKEAVDDLPYAQWLEEGKWKNTGLPQTKTVGTMAQVANKRAQETEKKKTTRREERKGRDMRNGGAAAHKAVKSALGAKKEYVQPTHPNGGRYQLGPQSIT